jgi:cell division protein FtsB
LLAQGLYRDHSWKAEARATRARVAALEHKVADASERASSAASDPAYLEALARRLGYVKEGERVIVPLPSSEVGR